MENFIDIRTRSKRYNDSLKDDDKYKKNDESNNSKSNTNDIDFLKDNLEALGSQFDNMAIQTHTHEYEASTKLAKSGDDRHNHRFAGITSQVIPLPCNNHRHSIYTMTDYFGHLHEVAVDTGPAINVGNGKHIHFVSGITTRNDGHYHEYEFTTSIEAPLLPQSNNCGMN